MYRKRKKFTANVMRFTAIGPPCRYVALAIGPFDVPDEFWGKAMRKSITLNWIEQAEAARVLIEASFDQAPPTPTSWCAMAADALTDCRDRLRGCCSRLAPQQCVELPLWQMQPARVRPLQRRQTPDRRDYANDW
jgi:protein involved in temperature-dependent protein secretion